MARLTDEDRAERERTKTLTKLCRQAVKALQPVANTRASRDRAARYQREWANLLAACDGDRTCNACGFGPLTVRNNFDSPVALSIEKRFTVHASPTHKRPLRKCPSCGEQLEIARMGRHHEPEQEAA